MTRTQRSEDGAPWIEAADAPLLAVEAALALLVRTRPSAAQEAAVARLAALSVRLRPAKLRASAAAYARVVGRTPGMPAPRAYAEALVAAQLADRLGLARLGADPGWRPEPLVVEGGEAVETALAEGRGVVLWLMPFEPIGWLVRLVARDRGWPYHHLSHVAHGPSRSRLGRGVLNARDVAIEARLTPRIVIGGARTAQGLAEVSRRLDAGEIVGFRGIGHARRAVTLPFFEGSMTLALGAPVFAARADALLASVAVAPEGNGWRLSIAPLDARTNPAAAGGAFLRRFEVAVGRAPAHWCVTRPQWRLAGALCEHGREMAGDPLGRPASERLEAQQRG
jgi:lauroyl/myristoyl acyltransferase